ncbi:uncharacterized protein LOC128556479 [Mercenaria mercenaria]|uniref:uncharacterized protein LOC128556479 n=1 Tax=Mercenaria mercenaria TaxID=6596 RepID=UPI00234F264A|nr:uncharacterized protein LOC128556479 [Mercenaria mercenaria]XP_053397756.1 uncharacterized protein LOC128556479 [Mercenaria mercenaria]
MSSKHRNASTCRSKVIQDLDQSDLFLVGGNALKLPHRPPDVTDYRGPLYHCDNHLYTRPASNISDVPVTENETRGLFNPHSRPPSGLQSRLTGIIPESYINRHNSDLPKPESVTKGLFSRPPSAYSRPTSAYRPVSRAGSLLDYDVDPDHEPITDVLSRLDEYSQNFVASLPPAYTDCECAVEDYRVSSRQARVYHSDSEHTDSDDEDAGVTMNVLLKTFQQFEDKGHSGSRQKAMMTLVNSYISLETITEQQLLELLQYMKTSVSEVQEACLVLLKYCVKNSQTLSRLLEKKILNFLYDCLVEIEKKHLRKSALLLLEYIFSKPEFKENWYELSVTKFLPKLISMVRGEIPLDVKYAACCVFRSFAQYEDFIAFVTDEILPSVLLMRNASAKFKEVYVEILTSLLSHTDCIPPDLVDSSAIPITVSIIREGPCGPQCAALHLLSSLTISDSGVSTVIGTSSLVPMLLCCMKESHCRKVRQHATEVIRNLCTSRKLGLCKDLMLQLSSYLVPSLEQDSLTSLSQMATSSAMTVVSAKLRFDEERQMWLGLEKFLDMTKSVIFREAKVEVDDLGLVTKVHMKPCIDTCPIQLGLLAQAFQVLQYMCLWPLDKSRLGFSANRVDLTTFTDDEKQRLRLSKVNRGLTQAIWDRVGIIVTDLLLSYADKFSKMRAESVKGRHLGSLDTVFEPGEVTLITSLLELTLSSALCTCVAFPDIMPKLEVKSPKRKSRSPSKLKSFSTPQISDDNKSSQNVESRLKSQSDSGKGFATDGYKVWEKETPYLTSSQSNTSHNVAMEKSKAELRHKEACTDRRLLRKCLYEADVFRCVCPFIYCSDESIQILVLQILRCLIQPLEERVAPKLMSGSGVSSGKAGRQRPQTAGAVPGTNKRLSVALHQMSPDMAVLIKEALGPPLEESQTQVRAEKPVVNKVNMPVVQEGLEIIHERLQEFTEHSKFEAETKKEPQVSSKEHVKPVIDRCRPIAQQCREALTEGLGERLVTGIFTKSRQLKKHSVLLLYDFVHFGEGESHMALSNYGCMPKLIDFLRVNEDNELLEIIGLIIVRILVNSDTRLRQLFNRHGGPQLLLSMAQYTKGLLKQEVTTTLTTVSKVESVRKRPMSAPVHGTVHRDRAPDAWDHIQARWRQEDQVAGVLRQWMIADRKHRRN